MPATKLVLLIVPSVYPHGFGFAVGVRRYEREHEPWRLQTVRAEPQKIAALKHMKHIDGAIGFLPTMALDRAVARLQVPAVNMSARLYSSELPRVFFDNVAAGRMAAEHLLELRLQHFAYTGLPEHYFSSERGAGFAARLAEAGREVHMHEFTGERRRLAWLRKLPRPIGILACNDGEAVCTAEACEQLGMNIPDDVALVGVDNSDLICAMGPVPITSIDSEGQTVGYHAAELLDRLMSGAAPPVAPVLVPARRLVVRASTHAVFHGDALVAKAAHIIREQACTGIRVGELVAALDVSRRTLEEKMKAALGRSPHEEIRRVQFERVKDLLIDTDLKIAEVAKRTGFGNARRMAEEFAAVVGMSPKAFRAQHATWLR